MDDDKMEYIELKIERGTKTRSGLEGQPERAFNPRMHAAGGNHYPVFIFKKYLSLRPPNTCKSDSLFYLQPANTITEQIWYKYQPVGVNSLSKYMKIMTSNAGIEGKKKQITVQKNYDNNFDGK